MMKAKKEKKATQMKKSGYCAEIFIKLRNGIIHTIFIEGDSRTSTDILATLKEAEIRRNSPDVYKIIRNRALPYASI